MQLIKATIVMLSAVSATFAIPTPNGETSDVLLERAHEEALEFLANRASSPDKRQVCQCRNGKRCCSYNWGEVCSGSC